MSRTKGKSSKELIAEEDLAIQDTLSMSAEERLELLANLIVDKIIEDDASGGELYRTIVEAQT